MKVTINKGNDKVETKPYPKLMKSNAGSVLLMVSEGCGVVLVKGGYYPVGYYSNGWACNLFEDFEGEVVLKND